MDQPRFTFKSYHTVGSPDAESDQLFNRAYVDNDVYGIIKDVIHPKCILVGRTGEGKSAILKKLEIDFGDGVTRIEPENMSLRFLSNSTILNHFKSLNINLYLFYKILWKHVFVIELLKLYFKNNAQKRKNIIDRIRESLIAKKESEIRIQKALEYLDQYSEDFWASTELRIKEIENELAFQYEDLTKASISAISAEIKSAGSEKQKIIQNYQYKAEQVINNSQYTRLQDIIKIMGEHLFTNELKHYYIIIDDLDKEWVRAQDKYDLICSMIDVIKEFKQFHGVKIIIALRENLVEFINDHYKHSGGQRDKINNLYINIHWDKVKLRKLIALRLMFATKLPEGQIKNLIYFDKRDNIDGLDFMIDRSYNRPRDVISFMNYALESATNKKSLTLDVFRKAEVKYSNNRLAALQDEWRENFGEIHFLYNWLKGRKNSIVVKNIKDEMCEDLYLDDKIPNALSGRAKRLVSAYQNGETKFVDFIVQLILILHEIGIIGIKTGPEAKTLYYYDNVKVDISDIKNESKIYVHTSLYKALSISEKTFDEELIPL